MKKEKKGRKKYPTSFGARFEDERLFSSSLIPKSTSRRVCVWTTFRQILLQVNRRVRVCVGTTFRQILLQVNRSGESCRHSRMNPSRWKEKDEKCPLSSKKKPSALLA
ncbi:hypothetical protein CEXT_718431 [Caerostris extrusa]|uniref:Uncharacterized protein n=1 Tax=Caerostris extrusa TaxID=172846 RepID=A0AAV4WP55_CAEEX|nr:hypothetical protein CEXT_718431 [Caerostris extrusa]